MSLAANPLTVLLLLPWAALWLAGGLMLAWGVFRLRPNEYMVVGVALGWLVQNWLANLLAQVLPVPLAFWLAAGIIFAAGIWVLARGVRAGERSPIQEIKLPPGQILALAAITLVFFGVGRGLAIFDDFAHLPTVSLMAAGDIPPHFALDPNVVYGYHHFLLLFAAQLIRVGGLTPWYALDAARALSFGLAVMCSALFAGRLTRSAMAGFLGGLVMALGSGARWLLLLVPAAGISWLGRSVQLIGSGAGSGASLGEALTNTWAVEGAGPLGFPFAFANGIYPAGVIQMLSANGLTGFVVIFILLLTFNRWRSGSGAAPGAILSAVIISIWGLLGEADLPMIAAGWGIVALAWVAARRSFRLPGSLRAWLGIAAAGCAIGVLEGGAWTDILFKLFYRISGQAQAAASYQTIGFQLGLPAVVSSHLGVLPILNPAALLVGLLELGPVLLVFPLLIIWGIKAFRLQRWYEAAAVAAAVFSLLMLCVQFSGSTGVRNTPRLYVFMPLLAAFAVPLFWIWAERRAQAVKISVAVLGLALVLGGAVMAGIELVAIQRPVYSYFLTPLDARMTQAHWNRLAPGALIFDPIPYRAPAVLGRATDSNFTWYQTKPAWEALYQAPDPVRLVAAGYRYAYLDNQYWDQIDPAYQAAFSRCASVIDEAAGSGGSFRRLLDLQNCR